MGRHGNRILGTALVGIGLLMLLGEMGLSFFAWTWPALLLIIGGTLLVQFQRTREDSGQVFTGTLLVLLAVFFQFAQFGFIDTTRHWPFFLVAPGLALLVMSRVDPHRRDAMVPGWIAIGVAAVGYFFSLGIFVWLVSVVFALLQLILKVAVPVGLVGLGGWLLFSHRHDHGKKDEVPEKVEPLHADEASSGASSDDEDDDVYGAVADLPPRVTDEDEEFDDLDDSDDPDDFEDPIDDADDDLDDEVDDADYEEIDDPSDSDGEDDSDDRRP